MTPEHPFPYKNASEMSAGLSEQADRVSAFVKSLRIDADDVELHVSSNATWGYRFGASGVVSIRPDAQKVTRAKIYRGGQVGQSWVVGDTREDWFDAAQKAAESLEPCTTGKPGAPKGSFPEPVTFDPQLADFACERDRLRELAEALLDNSLHEIERSDAQQRPSGGLVYDVGQVILARRGGVQSAISGCLTAKLSFDEGFVERVVQVHCPESFLPIALMGARAWRNMPTVVVDSKRLNLGHAVSLVIHPRALEDLLRSAGAALFTPDTARLIPNGVKVASEQVTLIDDPHLDGLRYSRGFDDRGVPTRRVPLIVNGRLTQRFSSGLAINPLKGVSGNRWYGPTEADGAEPQLSSILIDRGTTGFHELIGARPRHILINSLGPVQVSGDPTGRFSALIESAVLIDNQGPNRMIPVRALRLEGRLFGAPGGSPGLLSEAQVSRELHDTGSAVLPYLLTSWPLAHAE